METVANGREDVSYVRPRAGEHFVETESLKRIIERALKYLSAGFPVHFRGTSGTGKTTLALRVAELIGQPVQLIHGDEELTTSHLVGGESGYHKRSVRDNFIASVLKTEEDHTRYWVDNRLTVAIERGNTLIYDEFTRSRPEANNVLLSVLQEGILDLPLNRGDGIWTLKVHPRFRTIFTSNPEEYAGVHRSQDALRDRMVTLDLAPFDEETEIAITTKKSGLSREAVEKIVQIVRYLREKGNYEFAPTIRGCLMISKTVRAYGNKICVDTKDLLFQRICLDILTSETSRIGSRTTSTKVQKVVNHAISLYCRNGKK
ncbi:MAG: gas vesicle protein GvpN [Gammaproteobacteria bacterium]|nr:gas vesicle protein GvpN [Gammaproteobacteria bacterium]